MGDETAGGTVPPVRFPGVPVSAGTAAGILRIVADSVVGDANVAATPEEVAAAFTRVAAERSDLAARLRKAGRTSEAEIIAIGALIAGDPALSSPPWRRCRAERMPSPRCGRRPSARPR